ncbi:3-hydroxyacyl-CoA dehydrogenase NAD-binding domain-containing protein [Granulosicoccaceae sp. 1_MG-2023]|nr:3-hydroxyacyl-CoA dehydrogenase NAD-binding domain-containing protein [Granulosicoccaceae sp. 1_MG-2023]
MTRTISRIAVIGAGTMGAGIAGVCAKAGLPVVLLDLQPGAAAAAIERLTGGSRPVLSDEEAARITPGNLNDDLALVSDADWLCEVIVEKTGPKRELFRTLDKVRKPGSILSSNTSGIPLRDISADMPEAVRRDIAITHFFNPVHLMKLVELVPGEETAPDVIPTLAAFIQNHLGKGPVYAKDTINFIGNRIGCFWLLAGLHEALPYLQQGLSIEKADALLGEPVGLPATGFFGLHDLIGLDIMESIANNLKAGLPEGDAGLPYATFPPAVQAMFEAGQLGRKTGAGFYKLERHADGSKQMMVFNPLTASWAEAAAVSLSATEQDFASLVQDKSTSGEFVRAMMLPTLAYAADLVPQIADDIVNVDRAMRWGFNWQKGPFELIDVLGAGTFAELCQAASKPVPSMVSKLLAAGADSFYKDAGRRYFGVDSEWHDVPQA